MYNFEGDKNEAILTGRIVSMIQTNDGQNGGLYLTLDCGRKNYPKVFVNENVLGNKKDALFPGAVVSISANLQHSHRKEGKLSFGVWADEIEIFYEDMESLPLFSRVFYISGKIKSIKEKKNHLNQLHIVILLECHNNGRMALVPITVFNPKWMPKVDDYFQCCGEIETWKRQDEKGNTRYFESYVAKSYI